MEARNATGRGKRKKEKEKDKNCAREVIYGNVFLAHYLRGLKRPVNSVAAMEPVNRGHFFRLRGKRGREFFELILAWPPQAGLNFGALDSF